MFNLERAPRKPLPKTIDPKILEKMEIIEAGKWTVEDVLELHIDEISMATNVGTGPDKALGTAPYRDKKLEKIRRAYEEYLRRERTESSTRSVRRFFEEYSPDSPGTLIREFITYLREED